MRYILSPNYARRHCPLSIRRNRCPSFSRRTRRVLVLLVIISTVTLPVTVPLSFTVLPLPFGLGDLFTQNYARIAVDPRFRWLSANASADALRAHLAEVGRLAVFVNGTLVAVRVTGAAAEEMGAKPNGAERLRHNDEQCITQLELRGGRPALFPGEDPLGCEDRLLNQMSFVPPHVKDMRDANRAPPILNIVLMSGLRGPFGVVPNGRRLLVESGCAVSECSFSAPDNDSVVEAADVLLWQNEPSVYEWRKAPSSRKATQVWVIAPYESPLSALHFATHLSMSPNAINWTSGYRRDAILPDEYEHFVSRSALERLMATHELAPSWFSGEQAASDVARISAALIGVRGQENLPPKDFAAGKTRLIAWFFKNKYVKNVRLQYAFELAKHIEVHIYSPDGPYFCQKWKTECDSLLRDHYKFYLAFENSNCHQYITEKFFATSLKNDVLPIVMGAPPDDYAAVAPPHSFVHVDWFSSPKALADYLHYLNSNHSAYNEYFAWRRETGLFLDDRKTTVTPPQWATERMRASSRVTIQLSEDSNTLPKYPRANLYCRLCKLAHLQFGTRGTTSAISNHNYPDIDRWWLNWNGDERTSETVAAAPICLATT